MNERYVGRLKPLLQNIHYKEGKGPFEQNTGKINVKML